MYLPQWSMSPYCVKNNGFCTLSQEYPYWRNFDGKSQIAQFYWLSIVSPVILSSILCCSTFVGSVSHFYHNWINAAIFVTIQSFRPKRKPRSSWDISNDFHFSNLFIHIAANNLQDYIKSFSSHGWREKYFFLDQTKILSFWCPRGTLLFFLKGSIGLN